MRKTRRRLARIGGVVGATFLCASPALAAEPGDVTLTSSPPMYPGFHGGAPDYAVRCRAGSPVKLAFAVDGATRVSVGGKPGRSGRFTVPVSLAAGRAVGFKVDSGPDAGSYHLRCIPQDFPHWAAERTGSPQARWYLVTPIRLGYARPGYTIVFDRNGAPVWWMRESKGSPFTGSLLSDGIAWYPYQGTPYGIDKGIRFEEHALDGRLLRHFGAVGRITDHHELQVLPNNHALVISYVPRDHVDLRQLDPRLPSDATVVDGEIQEVDRNGKRVWRWSTKDHIALKEAARWWHAKPLRLRDRRIAYDIVHLNSVDVHGSRVVVSMRHTDAVYEIDKPSGDIVWKLGGTDTPQSLVLLGDPFGGSSFGGPHDPRLSDDGSRLTVFDNGTLRSRPPRAAEYTLDPLMKTATHLQSVTEPGVPESLCCGSARHLPGGDWVVSWGGSFVITETDPGGSRIFMLHFAEERQSYRAVPILPSQMSAGKLRSGMDRQAK
jgi:hypothetical protein